MSRWNRPMRAYRPAVLLCAGCGQRIAATYDEVRMVGGELYHVLCAPRREPSPELAARIARRKRGAR